MALAKWNFFRNNHEQLWCQNNLRRITVGVQKVFSGGKEKHSYRAILYDMVNFFWLSEFEAKKVATFFSNKCAPSKDP